MPDDVIDSDPWEYVFNTPLECGLRSVAILLAAYPQACDLQRLVQYDYLVVHSGDVEDGPPSIHPPTPHRSGELLVRRALVEHGLDFMASRMVIEKRFTADGIVYAAGEYAVVLLDSLTSTYVREMRERATWAVGRFQEMPDDQLSGYMRDHWSTWGSEFVRESLFSGMD